MIHTGTLTDFQFTGNVATLVIELPDGGTINPVGDARSTAYILRGMGVDSPAMLPLAVRFDVEGGMLVSMDVI